MEIKISKTKEGFAISGSLPPEFSSYSEFELFPLKEGAYLLLAKGFIENKGKPASAAAFSEQEKEVLRKLLNVRFEKRTPKEIGKVLTAQEQKVLSGLMEKKIVHIFKDQRYPEGVYSVAEAAFNAVKDQQPQPKEALTPAQHFEKHGWVVVEEEAQARALANNYAEQMKSGQIRGTRSFDKKFYFISRQFYQSWEKKALLALSKNEKSAEEVSAEIGLPADACRCILVHLCEDGEVMEKQKGKYSKA
ncbi:MAG: hypothetical protein QXT25_01160 [Candidatus Anstonellaceae archaeon]